MLFGHYRKKVPASRQVQEATRLQPHLETLQADISMEENLSTRITLHIQQSSPSLMLKIYKFLSIIHISQDQLNLEMGGQITLIILHLNTYIYHCN